MGPALFVGSLKHKYMCIYIFWLFKEMLKIHDLYLDENLETKWKLARHAASPVEINNIEADKMNNKSHPNVIEVWRKDRCALAHQNESHIIKNQNNVKKGVGWGGGGGGGGVGGVKYILQPLHKKSVKLNMLMYLHNLLQLLPSVYAFALK